MSEPAELNLIAQREADRLALRLRGRVRQTSLTPVWKQCETVLAETPGAPVTLDFTEAQDSDSSGAALVIHLRERCRAQGRPFEAVHLSSALNELLALSDVKEDLSDPAWPPRSVSTLERIGEASLRYAADVRAIFAFIGDLAMALVHAAMRPDRVRWRDTLYYIERTGADALPIMTLISVLVGLILAYLGYNQLHKYGGDVFVADGVAYGMCRLFGPLMVAILCAGRSGSAFASEIGTMKVSEEIDALDIMGLDRARFLVVPKVLAMLLMVPLLVLYANMAGMVGGFLVAVLGMDIAAPVYIQRSIQVLTIWTVCSGLVKSIVFALVVSAVGCLRGLQTKQGPQAVGEVTTSAVVSGFFLIVVVEGIFSVVYHQLGL
jgi:phospholipid/cholesterol/gamma-HCH transport system permease protein